MVFPLTEEALIGLLMAWLWPFLRISAMLLAMPIFGSRAVPVTVRLWLALTISAAIAPSIPAPPAVDPLSSVGVLLMIQQLVLGAVAGFMLQMLFSAVSQAGEMIALSMGLGFASINDPQNGLTVPVVSQYYVTIATLVFLALDGHLIAFALMLQSFTALPVGAGNWDVGLARAVVDWGSTMFALGVLLALPVVVAMLLVNLALGVVTRAAPQLNIFAVGFPAMLLIGLLAMMVGTVALPFQFEAAFDSALQQMQRLLGQ